MLAVLFLIVAALCFLLAALNQDLFGEGPGEIISWGLFSLVLSLLVGAASPYLGRLGDRK